jgi:hypothetical protein
MLWPVAMDLIRGNAGSSQPGPFLILIAGVAFA